MNTLDNLKLMIRHYPGGMEVVALRLGKAATTLEKELRGAEGFKLGQLDAEAISAMCIEADSPHCRMYATTIAGQAGAMLDLPVREMGGNLQSKVADAVKEASDVLMSATAALADGVVSDNDLKDINRQIAEAMEVLQSVGVAAKASNRASKARRA